MVSDNKTAMEAGIVFIAWFIGLLVVVYASFPIIYFILDSACFGFGMIYLKGLKVSMRVVRIKAEVMKV